MPPKIAIKSKKKKKRGRSPSNGDNHQAKARKINPPKAKTPRAPKWPRGLLGPNGMKLKQLRYHKFEKDVVIYHYQASFITVSDFRSLLNRQQHGYVNSLLGEDTLAEQLVPPGDETPPGCLEVGYLPSVFQLGGSALGFRVNSSPPTIEWLCFDKDIKSSILDQVDINTLTAQMLFEHVGTLERPPPAEKKWSRKVAYTEHKDWFESLKGAGRRPFRLGLTWKTFGTELMMDRLRKRDEQVRLKETREIMGGVAATDGGEGGTEGLGFHGYSDVEEEEEEAEEEDTRYAHQRDTDSPETTGRHTPFVYRDPVSNRNVTPQKTSRSNHSRSSSNASMLSDRNTNTPRTQPPLSANLKSKEQLLLEGGYV